MNIQKKIVLAASFLFLTLLLGAGWWYLSQQTTTEPTPPTSPPPDLEWTATDEQEYYQALEQATMTPPEDEILSTEDYLSVCYQQILYCDDDGSNCAMEPEEDCLVVARNGRTIDQLRQDLSQSMVIDFIQPIFQYEAIATDPQFKRQWALKNEAYPEADIQAEQAWTMAGTNKVLVAAIDQGIDYTHEDLKDNMWSGANCVDADGKPIAGGCIHGYQMVRDLKDPMPPSKDFSHGTHVAGTIGAAHNTVGVAGVAPNAVLMSLDVLIPPDDALESFTSTSTPEEKLAMYEQFNTKVAEAIKFAQNNHSKLINASINLLSFNPNRTTFVPITDYLDCRKVKDLAAYQAIKDFGLNGGLVVAGAGNENIEIGKEYFFAPASYAFTAYAPDGSKCWDALPNIIAVGSTDRLDSMADHSNFGQIHVFAPGQGIISTATGNLYKSMNGTSMATPHVTGIAALLMSSGASAGQAKQLILSSVDQKDQLAGKATTGGRVNACRAVAALQGKDMDSTCPRCKGDFLDDEEAASLMPTYPAHSPWFSPPQVQAATPEPEGQTASTGVCPLDPATMTSTCDTCPISGWCRYQLADSSTECRFKENLVNGACPQEPPDKLIDGPYRKKANCETAPMPSPSSSPTDGDPTTGPGAFFGPGGVPLSVITCADGINVDITVCDRLPSEGQGTCRQCLSRCGFWTGFGCISVDPMTSIAQILRFLLGVGGFFVTMQILVGAYHLITSTGDPQMITKAKDQITNAIIALLIIVFSVSILEFIGVSILQLPGFFN